MTRTWPLPLLLLLLAPACEGPNPFPKPRFWSMADLEPAAQVAPGEPCDNPAGLDCTYFVSDSTEQIDPATNLPAAILHLKLSFSEGAPAAYMTTDFWQNYDRIWIQPMYFLVTAWNDKKPAANRLLTTDRTAFTGPIFSVGPESAFYSPYWQVFYVEVPASTPADQYTSERQLFDDGLVMHPGPYRYSSISPSSVDLPLADEITNITGAVNGLPFGTYLDDPTDVTMQAAPSVLDSVVASAVKLSGWLDGAPVSYFDFGIDGFSADADGVVQDIPLFAFRKPDMNGVLQLQPVPFVGGVGPLFSGASAQVGPDNRPHFGGLWRLYFVTLPPDAGPFTAQIEAALGLSGHLVDINVNRVALNATQCLASATAYQSCVWLDSQAKIEQDISAEAIVRSPYEPACPFMAWDGAPVPNPVPVPAP